MSARASAPSIIDSISLVYRVGWSVRGLPKPPRFIPLCPCFMLFFVTLPVYSAFRCCFEQIQQSIGQSVFFKGMQIRVLSLLPELLPPPPLLLARGTSLTSTSNNSLNTATHSPCTPNTFLNFTLRAVSHDTAQGQPPFPGGCGAVGARQRGSKVCPCREPAAGGYSSVFGRTS